MSTTIATAASQYANRPKDERFDSPAAMIADAADQRRRSKEVTYNAKDLTIEAIDARTIRDTNSAGTLTNPLPTLQVRTPKGAGLFTHWSFGQLCRLVGAPAGYLRELPADIAAKALNYGLHETAAGTDAAMLVQAPNGCPVPVVRAITSEQYARVWDEELYGQIQRTILNTDDRWTTPPTWSGEPAGAYRGDRDSFLIVTNGGSIVTDPSAGDKGQMYRGLLVRNSETGASSIRIERILFRYVCGNHMLWGAILDRQFRRRHVGDRTLRDTIREINTIAYEWTNASAARDEAIIKELITRELAHTEKGVIDELKAIGFTEAQAKAAYARCEQTEHCSPRSYWGIAQGATRASQDAGYQDDRYILDQLAAKVLARGAQLVKV